MSIHFLLSVLLEWDADDKTLAFLERRDTGHRFQSPLLFDSLRLFFQLQKSSRHDLIHPCKVLDLVFRTSIFPLSANFLQRTFFIYYANIFTTVTNWIGEVTKLVLLWSCALNIIVAGTKLVNKLVHCQQFLHQFLICQIALHHLRNNFYQIQVLAKWRLIRTFNVRGQSVLFEGLACLRALFWSRGEARDCKGLSARLSLSKLKEVFRVENVHVYLICELNLWMR